MAKPSIRQVNWAVRYLYQLFSTVKTRTPGRAAVLKIEEVSRYVIHALRSDISLTVSDATDATITAFIASTGALGVAAGGAATPVGTVFKVLGAGDTTDNALAAAKLAGMDWVIAKTYTDATDATLAAFLAITGVIPAALGRVLLPGERFKLGGTGDTTDNALQAVKGSAIAAGDVFEVNAAGTGVTYLGNTGTVASGDLFVVTSSSAVQYLGTATEFSSGSFESDDFVSLGA